MYGDYTELGDEWDNLSIDSVSIQPSGVPSNTVYKVDPAFLSEVRHCQELGMMFSIMVSFYIIMVLMWCIYKLLGYC